MKLNAQFADHSEEMRAAGIVLPGFDVAAMREAARKHPRWIHIGPGNIFRVFVARLADELLARGEHWPITAVTPLDPRELDEQLGRHDLLTLGVTLNPDGTTDMRVIAGIGEGLASQREDDYARLLDIARDPEVTQLSFTITEKGYVIADDDDALSEQAAADVDRGPHGPHATTMALVAGMLHARHAAGGAPINLLSFDNFSHNGDKLRDSVLRIATEWHGRGAVEEDFIAWLSDTANVAFPISVIDKITPRPNERIAEKLAEVGFTDMDVHLLGRTPLAGFVNTEPAEYLVIEDQFAAPTPDWESIGVPVVERDVCDQFEHMKVTTCLNPLHTALAISGCLLGFDTIDEEMRDDDLAALVHRLGWVESLPVVVDPGIVKPADFLREVEEVRFPNRYLPDSPQRIAMDTSQKLAIRFGETLKAYERDGRDMAELIAIPLVFALWCRYLLAIDDAGEPFEPSSDPLYDQLHAGLADVTLGEVTPEDAHRLLAPILSRRSIFGVDLYDTPLAEKVEQLWVELVSGPGAVRRVIAKEIH